MNKKQNTKEEASAPTFEQYLSDNFRPSTTFNYYLYRDCDYPLVYIDTIKERYKSIYPQEASEYVEPIGFKGTKGGWSKSILAGTNLADRLKDDKGRIIADFYSFSEDIADEESEFNCIISSQSKELAKALQDFISDTNPYHEGDSIDYNHLKDAIENAKQVLHQAIN